MLYTYWVEHSKEVRTIAANTTLLPITSVAISETKYTPLFHQLEALEINSSGYNDGGMGYIVRLSDGRFIIVDGGHYTEDDATAIVNFLKENAPDSSNIVVATWLITHAHGDHAGAFTYLFEKLDTSNITLESMMFNACDTAEQMTYCTSYTENIMNVLNTHCKNVPVYKPLTGQVYTFADTSIEILYTMSDFLPNTIEYESDGKGGDYNIQTVVSIIDIDNTADKNDRFFIMGDTTLTACQEMTRRYGTYMQCDYVQVAHHGLNEITGLENNRRHGPDQATYKSILKFDANNNPLTIALWPTSKERYTDRTEITDIAVNKWLIKNVKANWIAGEATHTIEFSISA